MREKKKLVVWRSEVYNNLEITRNKYRGACVCRLRGSNPTSTLLPDADNAAVGSHIRGFFTGGYAACILLFYYFGTGETRAIQNPFRGRIRRR